MKYEFYFDIVIYLSFSIEEIECLDKYVRIGENKHEAEHGGKWYGSLNKYKFSKEYNKGEDVFLYFSFREIDRILLKSLEVSFMIFNREDVLARELYYKLSKILAGANKSSQKVNTKTPALEL